MALESINTILGTGQRDSTNDNASSIIVSSNDFQYRGMPGTPKPVVCEFCGTERYTKGFILGKRVVWAPYGAEHCTCPEGIAAYEAAKTAQKEEEKLRLKADEDKRQRERVAKIIGKSGMGVRFLHRTFDTFTLTPANRKAFEKAKQYVDNFEQMLPSAKNPNPGRNGLFIAGPAGTGKTHLAAAIANALMQQGKAVICMTTIDLLDQIKRTFAKDDVNEGRVLDVYKSVPLLIIDDMGKEPPTEWAVSTIYNIVNGRYEAYLPIVITTNYDSNSLVSRMTPAQTMDSTTAKSTIDRLLEMCLGVPLDGPSWRKR